MKNLPPSGIQRAACRLLCNLSIYEHNDLLITLCDGIELIIKTIRFHKGDKDIQTKAWETLRNLTSHKVEFRQQVVKQGGIDPVTSAAIRDSNNNEFFEKAQTTNQVVMMFRISSYHGSDKGCHLAKSICQGKLYVA